MPEEAVDFLFMSDVLASALAKLTNRERRVMGDAVRPGRCSAAHLDDVGKDLNLTRERIRQIEGEALSKLRAPERAGQLRN